MTSSTVQPSLDDVLGAADHRYFGRGYKNVNHDLIDLDLGRSTAPGTEHRAVAVLDYPRRWSEKGSKELAPHVSSIDTVALAAALLEAALGYTRRLDPDEQAQVWVSHAKVSAGTRPEEDLHRVPVSAVVTGVEQLPAGTVATTATFRVGQLRGTMTLIHPAGAGEQHRGGTDRVPGPSAQVLPFYLGGYKSHTLTARDLTVDSDSVTATVEIDIDTTTTFGGAETAWPRSVSVIDAVLGAAQLSQVLLYRLDGVDRTTSNTLWMRKLELVAAGPDRDAGRPFRGQVRVRRLSTIHRSGAVWRSADLVVTDFGGVTGSCLLAHELPTRKEHS
ncbi:MAG: AvrD family protein [Rhodococcus sp. (in: high G+C Gram-positive bacteria)]|uniref:AvrD family protein n=1 Tax=Rhodococcus sp. TaxID=1831 RepID=UPI003BAE1D99